MRIITKADGRKYLRISRSDLSKLQTKLAINWWEKEKMPSTEVPDKGIMGEEIYIPGVQYPSDSAYEEYLEELRYVREQKLKSESGLESLILYLTKNLLRNKHLLNQSKDKNERQELEKKIQGLRRKIDHFQNRLNALKGQNLADQRAQNVEPQDMDMMAKPLAVEPQGMDMMAKPLA